MDSDKLGNFENAFRFNKMYRCLFAKNLVFSTKILSHIIRIKIRQCERILLNVEIELNKVIDNLMELKNVIKDLLSIGQHIMCHKEIANVERRVDPNIDELQKKYKDMKNEILENLLVFFLNTIDINFKHYDNYGSFYPPSEFNESLVLIKKYWEFTFQDMEYFKKTLDLIVIALRKVVSGKFGDEINLRKWGKYFGKFAYEFFKLKQILNSESPFINIKKESSSFYHITRVLFQKLEYYFQQDLGNIDADQVFRVSKHFMELIASTFMVSNIWHIFFQENEFIMSEIPNEFNFKDPFIQVYGKSGFADINYRTCSEINELEEILLLHQKITDSLDEVSFTYDIDSITNLLDYKPALDNIYSDICVTEPELCLDVLFDKKTVQTFARVILKVDSTFNKKLVKLRKFGPITNIGISQNAFEENYYIKMGYMAPYQTSDKSLMLWICRNCGGNIGISQIKLQKGKVDDFASVVPDPTKALNIFQIYDDVVLVAERVLIDSFFLSPLTPNDNEQQTLLSSLLWDEDKNSSVIWESKGYFNTKTGFFLLFNRWNVNLFDWALENYPQVFNPNWTLENKCFCIITIGNSFCKKELLHEFSSYLSYEDSFDEYALWTFRTSDTNLSIAALQNAVKNTDCQLLNIFETQPNGNYALIDLENREGLIKDQENGDRKAADLYFERVPQKQLYICYQWLYPLEETIEIEFQKLPLVHVKHILRESKPNNLNFYKDILCDPTSRRFCSFIDDDYLKKRSYLDVHIVGLTAGFPVFSSSLNYVMLLNPLLKGNTQKICQTIYEGLDKIVPLEIKDVGDTLKNVESVFHDAADSECEISKIFRLQIPCPDRLKFIYQTNNGFNIDYICSEKIQEVENNLTREQRIPIERDFYLYVRITQTHLDKLNYNLEKIKELNYYFIAYWVKFPFRSYTNKQNKRFYFVSALLIRINYHHFNFIGIADTYSHPSCIDINNNYDRYRPRNKSRFSRDSFFFRHEQAFFNAIGPKKLEFYQQKYNLGSVDSKNWKIFLKKTQCHFSRFWIPISWQGDGASSCHSVFSVKSLKILPNRGIQETCDGSKLPIFQVYYLEVLAYSDPLADEFIQPTSLDLEIASKHGYVPYGNKLQSYTVIEGYHTKIRLWVKPKAKINSLRKVVCNSINDNENVNPHPNPPNNEEDIYSRVKVFSNEQEKMREENC